MNLLRNLKKGGTTKCQVCTDSHICVQWSIKLLIK